MYPIIYLPLLFSTCFFLGRIYLTWINTHQMDYQALYKKYFKKQFFVFAMIIIILTILGSFHMVAIQLMIASVFGLLATLFVITFLFSKRRNRKYSPMTVIQYGLSISLASLTIGLVTSDMYLQHYWTDHIEPLMISCLILSIVGITMALFVSFFSLFVSGFFNIFGRLRNKKKDGKFAFTRSHKDTLKKAPKNLKEHYLAHGMSPSEIDYFRSQMAVASQQIKSIEANFPITAKLRAIETRHNTIRVCQTFFKDIVEEPKRLNNTCSFLYKFLPSLEDLILKYNEVNGHVAKSKQTYQILDKTALTIDQVCQQITDEYILFHKETYDELQDEIQLATLNIERRNGNQPAQEEDKDETLIDQIIQEDLGGK